MTVLVTGATGFIGSRVVRRLLEDRHDVRGLHRPTSTFDQLGDVRDRIDWVVGDVTEPDGLYRAAEGIDSVVHVAAEISFGHANVNSRLLRVNTEGTANIVNAALAAGVKRLLHVSSIAALGRSPERSAAASTSIYDRSCTDESAEWVDSDLNTAYARSKYLAELEVRRGIAEGLDAVIVNPSVVMGVGPAGRNTTLLAERVRDGRIPFMPTGSTNVVDVLDVADGILKALDRGERGSRYILAGENLPWKDIIGTLAAAFRVDPPQRRLSPLVPRIASFVVEIASRTVGRRPLITRETVRLASAHACYDNTRARTELDCSFRPFADTAARLAAIMG